MGEPAFKVLEAVHSETSEFPLSSLLTRVLVESFCSFLKSELVFGKLEKLSTEQTIGYWVDAVVRGDLEGRVGLGAEEGTLSALAEELGFRDASKKTNLKNTLASLHEKLVSHFETQFSEEDFRCDLKKGSGFRENHQLNPNAQEFYFCTVETNHGILRVFVSLHPASKELKSEMAIQSKVEESRKIRVQASQIDNFASHVKELERLELRLFQGPEVRGQMRAQIKKMKRMLHQLKTEPLDTIFSPAQKMVTELSKQQGKQIELETIGTWLHLDKTLLNFLYEPILHLIRNAVDHGIEEPLRREQNGKRALAKIKILASFNQGVLRLLFSDDGSGLDFGSIREKSVVKGIFSLEEANSKAKEELAQLIFQPGFSTRSQTGIISGRGLGLDIVKKSLETIGGVIRLVSTSSHGTSFEILIPINEDFSPLEGRAVGLLLPEEQEKTQLLDELSDYQERFSKTLQALDLERTIQSAYEAYRLAHLIKGLCGFLGWQRVVSYIYPLEEVLKLLSEEKLTLDDLTLQTVKDAGYQLKDFCAASRTEGSFSLNKIRRAEARLLQLIWGSAKNDEKTHLFLGKYHLSAVENYFLPLAKSGSFSVRPESDFSRAVGLPYGAMVQFNGERRGFAGIYLPEKTLKEVIYPMISGSKEQTGNKKALWALTEFGNLMGTQFAESCSRAGITLQASAPLTYYGLGSPMRILGSPTYCFECEINGYSFFLAGDFRLPQELSESVSIRETTIPPIAFDGLSRSIEKCLGDYDLKVLMGETPSQSDLVGFDGGLTAVVSLACEDKKAPDTVMFISYESLVSEHLGDQMAQLSQKLGRAPLDFYDSIGVVSQKMSETVKSEFEKRKIKVTAGEATVFVGKAYVANFNRLFLTNKIVGNSEKGRIEVQILFTEFVD